MVLEVRAEDRSCLDPLFSDETFSPDQRTSVAHTGDAAHTWTQFRHCWIGGVPIVTATQEQLATAMVNDCLHARRLRDRARPRLIFSANGHSLSLRQSNPAFRAALDAADVVHADGGFLVTVSKWLREEPIPERSATTDLIHYCARAAVATELSFYLLGATEEVNEECARRLTRKYPGLKIAGRHHGFFDEAQEEEIVAHINDLRPDVLWVGLGKPKEQLFSIKWRDRLRVGWLVTCGGCYNYVAGTYSRAPRWVQDANLEWLYRAITNPRKLLWRYLTTTPHALWLALTLHDVQ